MLNRGVWHVPLRRTPVLVTCFCGALLHGRLVSVCPRCLRPVEPAMTPAMPIASPSQAPSEHPAREARFILPARGLVSDLTSHKVALEDVAEKTVGDVMIRRPKTLPRDAVVGDVRRAFERPGVRTVLLAANERFLGAIERGGLPVDAGGHEPARDTSSANRSP